MNYQERKLEEQHGRFMGIAAIVAAAIVLFAAILSDTKDPHGHSVMSPWICYVVMGISGAVALYCARLSVRAIRRARHN